MQRIKRMALMAFVMAATSTGTGIAHAAPPVGCDPAAITAGVGDQVSVLRCYGDWAYVTNGELGDSTSLVRLSEGAWQRYTGFPSSLCRAAAAADGVPAAELSSFRPC